MVLWSEWHADRGAPCARPREDEPMATPRLGESAPDFEATTTEGPIRFHDWKDASWAVLFSHPADFTPVCTTELGRVAALSDEWARRDVKVLAVSVDPIDQHEAWKGDIEEVGGATDAYDMIHPGEGDTSGVRSVFVIDPSNKVRLSLTYPKSVGRNFDEILRAVDALQLTDSGPFSTPADWREGQRVIVAPTVSTADARERFGADAVDEVKPYLLFTTAPA